MKFKFNKIFLATIAGCFVFASCSKKDEKIVFKSGTAPVLTSSAKDASTLNLAPKDSLKQLITFSWTNPNYQFSDGSSSQDVTYALQIDTMDANFGSQKIQSISPSPVYGLDTTFTVGQFNAIMGNGLLLTTGQPHKIQVRVVASLGNSTQTQLVSNVFNYTVTPYAPPPKVVPPSTGTLFIVGDATPAGWDNPIKSVDPKTQQFTQISNTEYTITISLNGGKEYKFIAVNGSWNEQWSVKDQDTYPDGGPFILNGANCIAPAKSGIYIIDVNFQTGTFTVTPQ